MPKILYFEDDTFLAGMYVTKLQMAGFDVVHRTTPGQDPIRLVLAERPDLIFTDIIMPVMDGFALTKLLRADSRTRRIPLFGMSNLGQPEDVAMARKVGMDAYWVSFAHAPAEVIEKIRSLFNGEKSDDFPPPPTKSATSNDVPRDLRTAQILSRQPEDDGGFREWFSQLPQDDQIVYVVNLEKRSTRAGFWVGLGTGLAICLLVSAVVYFAAT